jgi:hypothetical protein
MVFDLCKTEFFLPAHIQLHIFRRIFIRHYPLDGCFFYKVNPLLQINLYINIHSTKGETLHQWFSWLTISHLKK